MESIDFLFFFYYQSNGNRLHTTGRETWFYFSPQYRRQFISDQSVQNSSCLLGIDKVDVQISWIGNCFQDGIFCNLVKSNTFGFRGRYIQCFYQMPGNGFSVAVLIGCQPYNIRFFYGRFQFTDNFLFICHNFIIRNIAVLYIYADFFIRQIPHMTHTGCNGEIFS